MKAIRKRGWDPLDKRLLRHPEVAKTKYITTPETISCDNREEILSDIGNVSSLLSKTNSSLGIISKETNLNTLQGYANEVLSDIFNHSVK